MTKEKIKTSDELVEEELNKELAKDIVKRKKDIRRKKAEIKKLEKEIEKINSGELVPDEDNSSSSHSNKVTHVSILLDESGSMNSCRDQVIEGFNDYVGKLKDNGSDIRITLTKFDSNGVITVYKDEALNNIPKLNHETYKPNALTPLYDAIGKTINKIKKFSKTLFVIYTDGQENASKEYTLDSVRKLIKDKEKKDWGFVFLGADIDAWAQGGMSLGMTKGQTHSYASWDTKGTLSSGLSCYTMGFANGTYGVSDFSLCMDRDSVERGVSEKIILLNKMK